VPWLGGVEGPEPGSLPNLAVGMAGERLLGSVLLRLRPTLFEVAVIWNDGVIGLRLDELRECRDETDLFRLTPPNLRTLSAPALEVDPDRPRSTLVRPGVEGVTA
jgi:hypothetical protein